MKIITLLFLEVNKEGKYSYPKYEDYKALDEIYNHYAEEMSEILDYFGIEPENGIYNFTTDDLVRISKNYLEEQDKLLLGKIENTNIKR